MAFSLYPEFIGNIRDFEMIIDFDFVYLQQWFRDTASIG